MQKNLLKKIFLLLSLSVLVFFSLNQVLVKYVDYSGEKEINRVGSEIYTENSKPLSIINNIIDWGENKIGGGDVTYQKLHFLNFYVLPKPPFIYIRTSDPQWIMFFDRGACYEFASLFTEIGKSANLENIRKVRGLGKDHVWNEVNIGDNWIHVDPSKRDPATGEIGIINDPYFYERSENGEGDNLLFVYVLDSGGRHGVERTTRYIKESRLSKVRISVKKDGGPVEGARVTIAKGGEVSAPFSTNENGFCVFNLTKNRSYEIRANLGWGIGHEGTGKVFVTNNITLSVKLSTLRIQPPFTKVFAYLRVAFILVFPAMLILFLANYFSGGDILEVFREYKFEISYSSMVGFFLITIALFYAVVSGLGLWEISRLIVQITSGNLGKIMPVWVSAILTGWIFLSFAGMKLSLDGILKLNKDQNISLRKASNILGVGVIFVLFYGRFVLDTQILLLSVTFFIFHLIPWIKNQQFF